VAASERPRRVLDRTDILALATVSADAAAAGRAPPPGVLAAQGRRFELRLPFGCGGPASAGSDAPMRWRYDATEGVLRVHVAPVIWTTDDWWAAQAASDVETIEGFWIPRPWTSSEACPPSIVQAAAAATVEVAARTLAIAQFFTADAARQGRRDGQPFETSRKIEPDVFDASQGFRLRLTGRIGGITSGGPALCRQPEGADRRPVCVIAVSIEEVAIENATRQTLDVWNLDRRGQ